nr:MAG TPA: hypothetical protein [Caudoviricetes sp.]
MPFALLLFSICSYFTYTNFLDTFTFFEIE